VLKIWAGLTLEQIGEALQIPPNTAASRYRSACDQMRRLLSKEDLR
jgi:DNA-directed RNA polymerase specialized sigma24 family protein